MALPLLKYAPTTQNSRVNALRVGNDEDPKAVALDKPLNREDQNFVIEAAYRQIFFHAFKVDRDRTLESQLRDGQITVRDFIRSLCLSDTFTRSFYNLNNNYRVARHLVEKLLGRQVYGRSEEIAWSAVIMTRGIKGAVDDILSSAEYLENFGYDTVPYHRNRVVGSREVGETPFNITSPRYDAYYRGIFGFPQIVYTGTPKTLPQRAQQRRGGFPEDYLPWVRTLPALRGVGAAAGNAGMDYLSKVPYRSIGR
ncbi:MAG: phycobilisome rod-core linker polypeptide [Synechococcaceae cyanobacterium]|nr:phycobilisome rod-core linker polypeptide [Synechococcaceae cyanobacterium]